MTIDAEDHNMKLCDLKIRKLGRRDRRYKVAVGDALFFLLIAPTGGWLSRLAFHHDGWRKELAFGACPKVSLMQGSRAT